MKMDKLSHQFGHLKVNFIDLFYVYGITIIKIFENVF